ncbi:MAG: PT domain-containing protein [Acutalibacteraceae bacterium]|nr:PT domain-containing protein [Acutalibacteraceae bacterium]
MKKLLFIIIATALVVFTFTGCSENTTAKTDSVTDEQITAVTDSYTEATIKATEAPTEAPTPAPTEKPTEAPTEKPTEKLTEKPTEQKVSTPTEAPAQKINIANRLKYGYWVTKNGDNAITVYLFDGEELHNDYYEKQNNRYVKVEGPGYSNSCYPEIYENSFLVYSTGGVTTEFHFTDNPRVVQSYEDTNGIVHTWINYPYLPSVATVENDFSVY